MSNSTEHVCGGTKVFFGRGELCLHVFDLLCDLRRDAVLQVDDLQLGLADRLLSAGDLRNVLTAATRQLRSLAPERKEPRFSLEPFVEQ